MNAEQAPKQNNDEVVNIPFEELNKKRRLINGEYIEYSSTEEEMTRNAERNDRDNRN